ncbi:MAG: hypothetical protein K8R45_01225 [Desulfobacterales bacterium]|nr:hypothetical protein [Desulfobacterales bacterium]
MTNHASYSSAQHEAEEAMLSGLQTKLGLQFEKAAFLNPISETLQPDAIDLKRRVLVEVYPHIGKLNGAQSQKIRSDVIKFLFTGEKLGGSWRKVLCFADNKAAQIVNGKSWIGKAAKEIAVEVYVVPLPEKLTKKVLAAQKRKKKKKPK